MVILQIYNFSDLSSFIQPASDNIEFLYFSDALNILLTKTRTNNFHSPAWAAQTEAVKEHNTKKSLFNSIYRQISPNSMTFNELLQDEFRRFYRLKKPLDVIDSDNLFC